MRVVGRRWGYLHGCADWVGTRSLVCVLGVLPVPSGSGSDFGRHSLAKLRATERQEMHIP